MIDELAHRIARQENRRCEEGQWDRTFAPYPKHLVEQAIRRASYLFGVITMPDVGDIVMQLIRSQGTDVPSEPNPQEPAWERLEQEQEARWVKAMAFVIAAPQDHPARVYNREVHQRRNEGHNVDPDEHLAGIEMRSREQPLTGAGAALYMKLTKQGKIGVLGALQQNVAS